MQETWVQSLGWEDPLEEGMATHFSILVWRMPWTQEPGELQSKGSHRVGYNWSNLASVRWNITHPLKKNEIVPFVATWMDLENTMLSEIRQRKTNTMWCHSYVESKKIIPWMYTQNRNRPTDRENQLVAAELPRLPACISYKCPLLINLLLAYPFASHWIPSVLRNKEPEPQ